MSEPLHAWTRDAIDLPGALRDINNLILGGLGLVYSPKWCGFARVGERSIVDRGGCDWASDESVFEVRLFNDDYELRWLKQGALGAAALLTEKSPTLAAEWKSTAVDLRRGPVQFYLLWGTGVSSENKNGWSVISEPRIGAIDVPFANVESAGRLRFKAVEYLGEDKYGNVFVAEERLVGIEALKSHRNARGGT